jgi:hypothetical protein
MEPESPEIEGLKPLFQNLKSVSDEDEAALKIGIALFDASLRLILGAS